MHRQSNKKKRKSTRPKGVDSEGQRPTILALVHSERDMFVLLVSEDAIEPKIHDYS